MLHIVYTIGKKGISIGHFVLTWWRTA